MFTVGADPEVYLSNGVEIVPGYGNVPGTKQKPVPMGNGAIQADGTAGEFNIAPAENADALVKNITEMMGIICKETGLSITKNITKDWGKNLFDMPKPVWEIGCEPDFNAYTGQENKGVDASSTTVRCVGGHVHVGFDYNSFEDQMRFARLMDKHVGLLEVACQEDTGRSSLYGSGGAFRPKPFGMEYRTPSSWWIHDNEIIKIIYKASSLAYEEYVEGGDGDFDFKLMIDCWDTDYVKELEHSPYIKEVVDYYGR